MLASPGGWRFGADSAEPSRGPPLPLFAHAAAFASDARAAVGLTQPPPPFASLVAVRVCSGEARTTGLNTRSSAASGPPSAGATAALAPSAAWTMARACAIDNSRALVSKRSSPASRRGRALITSAGVLGALSVCGTSSSACSSPSLSVIVAVWVAAPSSCHRP